MPDNCARALIIPIDWDACPGNTKAIDMNEVPLAVWPFADYSEPRGQCAADGKSTGQTVSVQGMTVLNALNSSTVPDGSYFYNPQSGKIEVQWVHGIGSRQAAAPQARLMATVINGILTHKLPWGLIMLGVLFLAGGWLLETMRRKLVGSIPEVAA